MCPHDALYIFMVPSFKNVFSLETPTLTHETFKALKPGLSAYADDVEKVTIFCLFTLPVSCNRFTSQPLLNWSRWLSPERKISSLLPVVWCSPEGEREREVQVSPTRVVYIMRPSPNPYAIQKLLSTNVQTHYLWSWRDGSVVKNTDCSFRGPRFNF